MKDCNMYTYKENFILFSAEKKTLLSDFIIHLDLLHRSVWSSEVLNRLTPIELTRFNIIHKLVTLFVLNMGSLIL